MYTYWVREGGIYRGGVHLPTMVGRHIARYTLPPPVSLLVWYTQVNHFNTFSQESKESSKPAKDTRMVNDSEGFARFDRFDKERESVRRRVARLGMYHFINF